MQIKEYEKKLDDQKKLIEEMQRKAEQGSMQLQGEVQELALEEMLKTMFPIDDISGVAKGVKGADVIQTVRNRVGAKAGTILYESKRTKEFYMDWVTKLKSDAVLVKADVCVIVTQAMPNGIERIGAIDGVWICTYTDLKGLVMVLRDGILKISEAYGSQINKGDKMQMLYDYLMSNEFRLQLGAIIEGFTELQKAISTNETQWSAFGNNVKNSLKSIVKYQPVHRFHSRNSRKCHARIKTNRRRK